jgi:hypothetical protein
MRAFDTLRLNLAACVLATALPAAAQFDTRIEGLPAGLTVSVSVEHLRCGDGAGFGNLFSYNLTEQTIVVWERVPLFGGGWQLVQRTRTAYVAAPIRFPTLPGCGSGGHLVGFDLIVLGDRETRRSQVHSTGSPFQLTQVHATMEAKTEELIGIVNQVAVPLTAVTRGAPQHWRARYSSDMPLTSVVEPTLDFLQPGNFPFPGALFSRARLSIRQDGAVCVRVGTTTTCRAKALGGTLTVGDVSVDVRNTGHSGGFTGWRFTLLPSFPTGTVTVRSAANDFDSIEYLVDGNATSLDLLPWQPLSLPVLVN